MPVIYSSLAVQAATGGEDAYIIEGMWAGVADGVGGWAEIG